MGIERPAAISGLAVRQAKLTRASAIADVRLDRWSQSPMAIPGPIVTRGGEAYERRAVAVVVRRAYQPSMPFDAGRQVNWLRKLSKGANGS